MINLKPCPFCGGEPLLVYDGAYASVYCPDDCPGGNDLWWESSDEAVKAWNTRAGRVLPEGKKIVDFKADVNGLILIDEDGHSTLIGSDSVLLAINAGLSRQELPELRSKGGEIDDRAGLCNLRTARAASA